MNSDKSTWCPPPPPPSQPETAAAAAAAAAAASLWVAECGGVRQEASLPPLPPLLLVQLAGSRCGWSIEEDDECCWSSPLTCPDAPTDGSTAIRLDRE